MAPVQGLLREVWQAGHQAEGTQASACDADWVRTAAYGYVEFDENHNQVIYGNRVSEEAPNGTVKTTTYDSLSHSQSIAVTSQPPAGQGPALTTTYQYYGFSGQAGGGSGLHGQLQQQTNANGAVTRYSYDAWGRLTEVRQPGVDFAYPASERYTYRDGANPDDPDGVYFRLQHSVRDDAFGDDSPNATYRESWAFYDGLGQLIQTQDEATVAEASLASSTGYNARGQVVQQSLPYTLTAPPGDYQLPNWSALAQYVSRYDGMGRATGTINPDQSTRSISYDGRRTILVDEKQHQQVQEVGRVWPADQGRGVHGEQHRGPSVRAGGDDFVQLYRARPVEQRAGCGRSPDADRV